MNIKILILLIFVTLASSFSTSPRHFQTVEEKQAYLDELIALENSIKNDTEELKKLVNKVSQKANTYNGYDSTEGQALETGLQEERKILFGMEKKLVLPLQKKTWECKNLTQEESKSINEEIAQTQKKLNELNDKIEQEGQCTRNQVVKSEIAYLGVYLDHLLSQLRNVCQQTSTTVYKIIDEDSDFIYGSLTPIDYERKLQQYRDLGYTTLKCSPSAPFPSKGRCISCSEGEVFDLSRELCGKCPNNLVFNKKKHSCISAFFNTNFYGQNYNGKLPKNDPDYETCPSSTPFFNGIQCISCPLPKYFSFLSETCEECQNGFVFDLSSKTCGYEKKNSKLGPLINYCCEGEQPKEDPNLSNCPNQKPFFDGSRCINCDLPSYFSLSESSCKFCPDSQSFSLKDKKCVPSEDLQPVYKSLINSNSQNYEGQPHAIPDNYENVIDCTSDKPFSNLKKCLPCDSPNYFNFNSNLCESCKPEWKFNENEHKCVFIATGNQYNTNLVGLRNYQGKIPQYDSSLPTCPQYHPFFDGNTCLACSLPKYIDFDKKQCTQCDRDRQFNVFNRQCEYKYNSYFTDLDAKNIFFNGNFDDLRSQIDKRKEKNPSIVECASRKPFYNALTNSCITCPNEFPLFDIKYNRCMKCSGESNFSEDTHVCMSKGSVSPTIERMIMNTIGWP